MKTLGKIFVVICVLASSSFARAATHEEKEIADTMIKQIVDYTNQALKDMAPNQLGVIPRNPDHTNDFNSCYMLAFLYKTPHPLNPYYGKTAARDKAIAIADRISVTKDLPEWPLYLLSQTYDLLRPDIPESKSRAWKAYVADYVNTRGMEPFFYTSPNHEAWNAMAIYRAGQVFGEKQWMTMGARLMHELLKMQTPLGYFDEGPHHGPSMKYNNLQLTPMLLYYEFSGDPQALAASKKLADFMIRYSFPDGSPIAAFDGRQSYSFGYFGTLCYGLGRWPLGESLVRRIYNTRKKWGVLDAGSPHYKFSNWYADFSGLLLVDEYRSLLHHAAAAPLPQDKDGYRAVDNRCTFRGGVVRRHDWMVALSAINSDVPRYSHSIYQLERQSRIDIWNQKTGLVIGGGSNMVGAEMPLANFELLTGFKGVDGYYGHLKGGNVLDREAVYFPRVLKATLEPDRQTLAASFGHGDFFVEIRPVSETRLELNYSYDILVSKQAFIQLPVILFYNSKVTVDGNAYDRQSAVKVKHQMVIQNPATQSTVTIVVPQGSDVLLNQPVYPLRWYVDDHEKERYTPYYQIALLSLSLNPHKGKGGGKFLIEVK